MGITNGETIPIYIFVYEGPDIKLENSHTTKTFIEAINLSKIYFNKNSIDFLNNQILENISINKLNYSNIIFNTFITYLFKNIELFDIDKFLLFSGIILKIYGIRQCTDIDFYIWDNIKEIKTKNFLNKIETKLLNKDTKFYFIDGFTKFINNNKYWNKYWDDDWYIEWANMFGANHISETVFNPKYHFYYLGLKFITLDAEITKRKKRHRPAAVADLIMINKLLNKNIIIDPIPKKILDVNTNYTKYKIINKYKFLNTLKYYLKSKYNKHYHMEQLKEMVKFL